MKDESFSLLANVSVIRLCTSETVGIATNCFKSANAYSTFVLPLAFPPKIYADFNNRIFFDIKVLVSLYLVNRGPAAIENTT